MDTLQLIALIIVALIVLAAIIAYRRKLLVTLPLPAWPEAAHRQKTTHSGDDRPLKILKMIEVFCRNL